MKVITYSLRLSLTTALILLAAWLEPAGRAGLGAGTHLRKSSVSRVGLSFVASLAKAFVSREEPITIKLTLTNNTKKEIVVVESNPLADYKIDVRDGLGSRVPPTPEGKDLLFRSQWGGRRLAVRLTPGENKTDTFEVNKIYDMTKPGSYTITARRTALIPPGKSWIELKSNEVKVLVRR